MPKCNQSIARVRNTLDEREKHEPIIAPGPGGQGATVHAAARTAVSNSRYDFAETDRDVWHFGRLPLVYNYSKHSTNYLIAQGFTYDAGLMGDDIPYILKTDAG